jgi:hypothetical protein
MDELRDLMGDASPRSLAKELDHLDDHCHRFIAASPFLLLGSSSALGRCDVSPKGDGPGFVLVLDERTIVIPDRPGNKRFDGLANIIENPYVGTIFMIPNVQETLRINGRATIIRDAEILGRMAVNGKVPDMGIAIEIEQVFLHCPKAFIRSSLWDRVRQAGDRPVASFARMLIDHTKTEGVTEEEVACELEERNKTTLY